MFDHLLESSQRDDSNKWSNIGFGEEMMHIESVEVNFTPLIWSSETTITKWSWECLLADGHDIFPLAVKLVDAGIILDKHLVVAVDNDSRWPLQRRKHLKQHKRVLVLVSLNFYSRISISQSCRDYILQVQTRTGTEGDKNTQNLVMVTTLTQLSQNKIVLATL